MPSTPACNVDFCLPSIRPWPATPAPGGQWRVVVPHGAASFRAYGGLGYFHGGASLHEWFIPCVSVEWPLEAKPPQVKIEPLGQVQRVDGGLQQS